MGDFGVHRAKDMVAADMDLIQFVDVASNVIRSALNRNSNQQKRRVNHRRFLQKQVRRYQAENGVSALVTCTPSRTRASKTSKSNNNKRASKLHLDDTSLLQVVPEFSTGSPSELSRADTNSTAPSECSFTESCDDPMCESWETLLTPIDYHNVTLPTTTTAQNQYLNYPETLYHTTGAPEEDNWGWMPSQPDLCYPTSGEWLTSDMQAVVPQFTEPQSIRQMLQEQPKRACDQSVTTSVVRQQGESDAPNGNSWIADVFQQQQQQTFFTNEFNEWYNETEIGIEVSSIYQNQIPSSPTSIWDTSTSSLQVLDDNQDFNPINDDLSFTELVLTNFNPACRDQRASCDAYY